MAGTLVQAGRQPELTGPPQSYFSEACSCHLYHGTISWLSQGTTPPPSPGFQNGMLWGYLQRSLQSSEEGTVVKDHFKPECAIMQVERREGKQGTTDKPQ